MKDERLGSPAGIKPNIRNIQLDMRRRISGRESGELQLSRTAVPETETISMPLAWPRTS